MKELIHGDSKKKKIRVVWLTNLFDDSAVSNIFLKLFPFYNDVEFSVVSLSKPHGIKPQALALLEALKVSHLNLNCAKLNIIRSITRLHAYIQKIKPDIVHAQLGASFVTLMLCPSFPHKFIKLATFHNTARYFNPLTYRALKIFFSRFDAVSAVSMHCLKTIQDHFDSAKKLPARCIYNPVELRLTESKVDDEYSSLFPVHTQCISLISRLTHKKGHHLAFKALSCLVPLLKEHNITSKVLIIGDGLLRGELEHMAHQLGLGELCVFLGYRQDIYELILRSTFVLYPSEEEGFGLVPCESLLLAKPVLVNTLPVYDEIIDDQELICDCSDVQSFANKMFQVLTNTSHYNKIALRAQPKIRAMFDPKFIASKYESFYREYLKLN